MSGNRDKTLFLRHESGATHALRGKRLAKLLSELKAGRGMKEVVSLQLNGYMQTMGGVELSREDLATALQDEANGKVESVESES